MLRCEGASPSLEARKEGAAFRSSLADVVGRFPAGRARRGIYAEDWGIDSDVPGEFGEPDVT